MTTLEIIIFYILLIDSVGANLVAWLGSTWYTKHFQILSRYFPPSKGWCGLYLFLVIWVGTIIFR